MPNNPNAADNLLPAWRPGQSGNPRGSSKRQRRAARLRQALDVILGEEIPAALAEQIDPEIRSLLPEDVTFAEVIALRLALAGAASRSKSDLFEVARLAGALQAKPDEQAPPEADPGPPSLATTQEQRRALMRELGVNLADGTETIQ